MTSDRTVVVSDCDHDTLDPERTVLSESGFDLRLEQCRTAQDVVDRCADARVLLNQYAPVTDQVLGMLPDLRLVVRYGVGVDNVDVEAATRHGVWVANVPDYGTEEVADHAVALALTLLRGISLYDRHVRSGSWDYTVGRPLHRLSTLTFGLIGCGAIGTAAGLRAAAHGMRVLGFDADSQRPDPPAPIRRVDLAELLAESDVVSLHATLDPRSRGLLDSAALARMKPGAYLVNTARGGLMDTAALVEALDSGRLAGAGLDVLDVEPIEPAVREALVRHPQVVLSPHAAWYSEEAYIQLKTEAAREGVRVLRGERPRCPVNEPAELRGRR